MRVIHVITRLILGGAQENTVASVLGLRDQPGWKVSLISGPPEPGEGSLENAFAGCPDCLTLIPSLVRPLHPWLDGRAFARLVAVFRRDKPDLVHTHSGKAGFLGRLAARRADVPLVVHTIHGPSFGPFQGPLANALFLRAERVAGRCTTHFVSVAHALTRQYLAAGIGHPAQYTRILSGFPLDPFLRARNDPELRRSLGLAPEHVVAGVLARLCPLKGHEDLLAMGPDLVRACPSLRFLLVGDGPWRSRLQERARTLGLSDRFVFAGLVPPERVPALLGAMDFLVHLSRREGLARSLSQALCAGRPVVACDCDGASEVCLDGETGFLVQPGDLSQCAERILRLARDPDLRLRLGRNGRELVRQRFSVETMLEELRALYRRLTPEC